MLLLVRLTLKQLVLLQDGLEVSGAGYIIQCWMYSSWLTNTIGPTRKNNSTNLSRFPARCVGTECCLTCASSALDFNSNKANRLLALTRKYSDTHTHKSITCCCLKWSLSRQKCRNVKVIRKRCKVDLGPADSVCVHIRVTLYASALANHSQGYHCLAFSAPTKCYCLPYTSLHTTGTRYWEPEGSRKPVYCTAYTAAAPYELKDFLLSLRLFSRWKLGSLAKKWTLFMLRVREKTPDY